MQFRFLHRIADSREIFPDLFSPGALPTPTFFFFVFCDAFYGKKPNTKIIRCQGYAPNTFVQMRFVSIYAFFCIFGVGPPFFFGETGTITPPSDVFHGRFVLYTNRMGLCLGGFRIWTYVTLGFRVVHFGIRLFGRFKC